MWPWLFLLVCVKGTELSKWQDTVAQQKGGKRWKFHLDGCVSSKMKSLTLIDVTAVPDDDGDDDDDDEGYEYTEWKLNEVN